MTPGATPTQNRPLAHKQHCRFPMLPTSRHSRPFRPSATWRFARPPAPRWRATIRSLTRKRDALIAACDALLAERDALLAERDRPPGFAAVLRAARQWHIIEIRRIAEAAIRAANDPTRARNEYGPRSFLIGYVANEIDPEHHPRCIVRAMASLVLVCSTHGDAHEKNFGGSMFVSLATRAASAMRCDVWEILESRVKEWE